MKRLLNLLVLFAFCFSHLAGYGASANMPLGYMPPPGVLTPQSPVFNAPLPLGIEFDSQNPLRFKFLMEKGSTALDAALLRQEGTQAIRYFLAALALPAKDLWVNLSPYEQKRIAGGNLTQTDLGTDLLGEDYVLKQLAASLTYPETEVGKKYWQSINDPVGATPRGRPGQAQGPVPTNSFNKIWIVPGEMLIKEDNHRAVIAKATLKVMMQEDYLAMQKNNVGAIHESPATNAFKQNILPLIEKEVNEGKNFSRLRQVYRAVMLAGWFRNKLRGSFLDKAYFDKNRVKGVNYSDFQIKEKIYNQYLAAFKQGAYNYIKKDVVGANGHSPVQKISKRQYFSGGVVFMTAASGAAPTAPLVGEMPKGSGSLDVEVKLPRPAGSGTMQEQVEILGQKIEGWMRGNGHLYGAEIDARAHEPKILEALNADGKEIYSDSGTVSYQRRGAWFTTAVHVPGQGDQIKVLPLNAICTQSEMERSLPSDLQGFAPAPAAKSAPKADSGTDSMGIEAAQVLVDRGAVDALCLEKNYAIVRLEDNLQVNDSDLASIVERSSWTKPDADSPKGYEAGTCTIEWSKKLLIIKLVPKPEPVRKSVPMSAQAQLTLPSAAKPIDNTLSSAEALGLGEKVKGRIHDLNQSLDNGDMETSLGELLFTMPAVRGDEILKAAHDGVIVKGTYEEPIELEVVQGILFVRIATKEHGLLIEVFILDKAGKAVSLGPLRSAGAALARFEEQAQVQPVALSEDALPDKRGFTQRWRDGDLPDFDHSTATAAGLFTQLESWVIADIPGAVLRRQGLQMAIEDYYADKERKPLNVKFSHSGHDYVLELEWRDNARQAVLYDASKGYWDQMKSPMPLPARLAQPVSPDLLRRAETSTARWSSLLDDVTSQVAAITRSQAPFVPKSAHPTAKFVDGVYEFKDEDDLVAAVTRAVLNSYKIDSRRKSDYRGFVQTAITQGSNFFIVGEYKVTLTVTGKVAQLDISEMQRGQFQPLTKLVTPSAATGQRVELTPNMMHRRRGQGYAPVAAVPMVIVKIDSNLLDSDAAALVQQVHDWVGLVRAQPKYRSENPKSDFNYLYDMPADTLKQEVLDAARGAKAKPISERGYPIECKILPDGQLEVTLCTRKHGNISRKFPLQKRANEVTMPQPMLTTEPEAQPVPVGAIVKLSKAEAVEFAVTEQDLELCAKINGKVVAVDPLVNVGDDNFDEVIAWAAKKHGDGVGRYEAVAYEQEGKKLTLILEPRAQEPPPTAIPGPVSAAGEIDKKALAEAFAKHAASFDVAITADEAGPLVEAVDILRQRIGQEQFRTSNYVLVELPRHGHFYLETEAQSLEEFTTVRLWREYLFAPSFKIDLPQTKSALMASTPKPALAPSVPVEKAGRKIDKTLADAEALLLAQRVGQWLTQVSKERKAGSGFGSLGHYAGMPLEKHQANILNTAHNNRIVIIGMSPSVEYAVVKGQLVVTVKMDDYEPTSQLFSLSETSASEPKTSDSKPSVLVPASTPANTDVKALAEAFVEHIRYFGVTITADEAGPLFKAVDTLRGRIGQEEFLSNNHVIAYLPGHGQFYLETDAQSLEEFTSVRLWQHYMAGASFEIPLPRSQGVFAEILSDANASLLANQVSVWIFTLNGEVESDISLRILSHTSDIGHKEKILEAVAYPGQTIEGPHQKPISYKFSNGQLTVTLDTGRLGTLTKTFSLDKTSADQPASPAAKPAVPVDLATPPATQETSKFGYRTAATGQRVELTAKMRHRKPGEKPGAVSTAVVKPVTITGEKTVNSLEELSQEVQALCDAYSLLKKLDTKYDEFTRKAVERGERSLRAVAYQATLSKVNKNQLRLVITLTSQKEPLVDYRFNLGYVGDQPKAQALPSASTSEAGVIKIDKIEVEAASPAKADEGKSITVSPTEINILAQGVANYIDGFSSSDKKSFAKLGRLAKSYDLAKHTRMIASAISHLGQEVNNYPDSPITYLWDGEKLTIVLKISDNHKPVKEFSLPGRKPSFGNMKPGDKEYLDTQIRAYFENMPIRAGVDHVSETAADDELIKYLRFGRTGPRPVFNELRRLRYQLKNISGFKGEIFFVDTPDRRTLWYSKDGTRYAAAHSSPKHNAIYISYRAIASNSFNKTLNDALKIVRYELRYFSPAHELSPDLTVGEENWLQNRVMRDEIAVRRGQVTPYGGVDLSSALGQNISMDGSKAYSPASATDYDITFTITGVVFNP